MLELLAPAGNLEKLQFALAYGADAVYAGVPAYSLRARENRFQIDSVKTAIEYVRSKGKQVYLTMNIYAHNNKIPGFLNAFAQLAELKPDAFIMTDLGLITQALSLKPETVIHLSTQANATNWAAVKAWQDLGIKRIILPRELSLSEIAEIHHKVPGIELEAFVHGAVCIAYSGRCLISNYLNHRDANQGTCANSCRWQYKLALDKASLLEVEQNLPAPDTTYQPLLGNYCLSEPGRPEQNFAIDEDQHGTYIMNSRDLCAIELLGELAKSGVCSFKIEGRTKSEYYLAVITRAYRRAIDDLKQNKPFRRDNFLETLSASSRTYTTGFYLRPPKEYGENFNDADSLPLNYQYCARVINYFPETGLATIDVKNKITLDTELEWICPQETITSPVKALYDCKDKTISEVSGGQKCKIEAPCKVDNLCLVRKKINCL